MRRPQKNNLFDAKYGKGKNTLYEMHLINCKYSFQF